MRLPRIRKISTKVALSFALIVLLQGFLSILTLSFVTRQAMQASLEDQRQKTRLLIERFFADARKEVIVKADLLAGQAKIAGYLAAGLREEMSRELAFYISPLKLDTILVVDAEGNELAVAGNRSVAELLMRRNVAGLIDGEAASTTAGMGNRIQLWGLHEIVAGGRRRGALGVALSLDRSFIGRVEEVSSTVMLLALRKTILVNGRVSDNVFIEYSRRVAADPDQGASGSIKSWAYRTTGLQDFPDLEMAYFIDTAPSTALLSRYVASTLAILAIALFLAFVMSLLLYRYSFAKPFLAFQDAIRTISHGDLSFRFSERADDEFAGLEREFELMTSNLKKLEQRLQISSRMAAIGEMVAGVAHQIRNPLAVMKVSAEMIRDALPARPAGEAGRGVDLAPLVDMITGGIDSLSAVVAGFLDFTRPLRVTLEDLDAREFLERAMALVPDERFPGRILRVQAVPEGLRARLDRHLMEQVVINLVANALEATEPGGRIDVRATREEVRFRISVADRGKGMSEELKAQLFHPFFTTKSDGNGLGLSIVHRIVEEHRGSIEVRSAPGEGTEISITFQEA